MNEAMFLITEKEIKIEEIVKKIVHANAGAINTFIGTVREMTNGKRTLSLQYEAYVPMAVKQLEQIGTEITEQWPDAVTAISHRIGRLGISDIAVVIAVSSPHRDAAFAASRYAIERIKEIVPIWKKEQWEDGTMWVGDQKETTPYPQGRPKEEGKN